MDQQKNPLQFSRQWLVIIRITALFLGAAAYWLPLLPHAGACGSGTYTVLVQALVLLCLGVVSACSDGKHKFFSYGGGGFAAGWLIHVQLSLSLPQVFSCSHQFLPFEAALLALLIIVTTLGGSFVGARFRKEWATTVIANALAVASILTAITPWVMPWQVAVQEQHALQAIVDLGEAQLAYSRSHPTVGYACKFSEFSTIKTSLAGRSSREDHYWRDGYHYHLICYKNSSSVIDQYALWVVPVCVPDCGNVAYCVNGSGEVRSISRSGKPRWWQQCWERGIVIRKIL